MRRDQSGHPDHVALSGDWALWRDFAVRSAGFPVSGLDDFGAGDEGARMGRVAADPLFREAVAWQNRQALTTQVDTIARGAPQTGSKRRRRETVVANYWQRYCAKNDMIGFFGPLAWGSIRDEGPAVAARSGGLVAGREVHFETWCMEAIARQMDPAIRVPLRLRPEREMRAQIRSLNDPAARDRATRVLDRLEAARDVVAAARGDDLVPALDAFDRTFSELTGDQPVRPDGGAGGRTPLFLDCTRDLEIDVGPALVQELACSLPPFLDSARWYCGRSFALGQRIVAEEVTSAPVSQPLRQKLDRVMSALLALPRLLRPDLEELQRRWAILLAEGYTPSLADRGAAAFADASPAWPAAVYQSPDVQIAARSLKEIGSGQFLAVIGDFHPANALLQGMFSERHPDPDRLREDVHADLGSPLLYGIPRRAPGMLLDARIVPSFTWPDDVHVAMGDGDRAPDGYRTITLDELLVDGDECTDRAASFRAPLAHLFYLPMFLAAMRTFDPFPVREHHGERITVGRTVLRRETWAADAGSIPAETGDFAAWARARGLPRRLFCRPPGEPKPVYADLDSRLLTNSLHRMLRRVAAQDPRTPVLFTEMLPGPDECWLEHDGARYTSELRLVAVDLSRRGAGQVTTPRQAASTLCPAKAGQLTASSRTPAMRAGSSFDDLPPARPGHQRITQQS
jgi:Lantibiotic dehydratase, N terminus